LQLGKFGHDEDSLRYVSILCVYEFNFF
jgi:hypothetical protein